MKTPTKVFVVSSVKHQYDKINVGFFLCFFMFYACKNDTVCTDSNTTNLNVYDTIYKVPCQQIKIKNPFSFLFYETLENEPNYGKPLIQISYASKGSDFFGECEKGKASQRLPYEDLYLENLSTRNYTITYTLGDKTPSVVKLKAGEKKFTKNVIGLTAGLALINVEYE